VILDHIHSIVVIAECTLYAIRRYIAEIRSVERKMRMARATTRIHSSYDIRYNKQSASYCPEERLKSMLDFKPLRSKKRTMRELVEGLGPDDLRHLTDEMIDAQLKLIAECTDADVTFEPSDPGAHDPAAATEAELNLPWTLGHLIVHITASSEEAAAIAAELARGVPHRGGRSRSEVHWTTITTLAQCRERLEESRRMRLASLDMWPAQPYLDNTYVPREGAEPTNAVMRFAGGLRHDDDHMGQIADVVAQARAARS
jgi:hypothetical protein